MSIDVSGYSPDPPQAQAGGGGGGVTNRYNNSAVPSYDQWMYEGLYVGSQRVRERVRDTQHGSGGKGLDEVSSHATGRVDRVPYMATPFALLQAFDSMSQPEYQKFKNKLVAAGFVSTSASPVDVRDAWAGILRDVQSSNTQRKTPMSPFEFLNALIKKNGIDPKDIPNTADYDPAAQLAANQFQPSTSKVTSVYDLAPEDAEQMLTQMLQSKLGRDPSKAELEDFVDTVKARALANPTTVTTKTRQGDLSGQAGPGTQVEVAQQGDQTISTVRSISQGFDQNNVAAIADRRAENAPDYASYQAVATYMPALLQALGSTV